MTLVFLEVGRKKATLSCQNVYSIAGDKLTHGALFFPRDRAHDTVGAVAVDCAGNVACATSTGGIRNKMVGRVGDSPIVGTKSVTCSKCNFFFNQLQLKLN